MKTRRCNFTVGLMAVMAAFASPAGATVQIFTDNYGTSLAPLAIGSPNQNLSLSQFNPSLGTLIGVTVELISYDSIQAQVLNMGSSPVNYSADSAYYDGTQGSQRIGVSASGGSLTLATSGSGSAGPFQGTAAPLGVTVAGTTPLPQVTDILHPANFTSYEGTGQIQYVLSIPVVPGHSTGSDTSLLFGSDAYSYGTIEVQYNYAQVPETGALWGSLFAIGLCAVELARRRQTAVLA
jgi:hypothetical protein